MLHMQALNMLRALTATLQVCDAQSFALAAALGASLSPLRLIVDTLNNGSYWLNCCEIVMEALTWSKRCFGLVDTGSEGRHTTADHPGIEFWTSQTEGGDSSHPSSSPHTCR